MTNSTDNTTASAFSNAELECELQNLAQMARIAYVTCYEVIGETDFKYADDAKTIFECVTRTDLTPEGVRRALFAVGHVEDMIKDLRKKLEFD
jgi:hypothetical protein